MTAHTPTPDTLTDQTPDTVSEDHIAAWQRVYENGSPVMRRAMARQAIRDRRDIDRFLERVRRAVVAGDDA